MVVDGNATEEWSNLGGELRQHDPVVYGEMKEILAGIVRSLRMRTKKAAAGRAVLFGPARSKPSA